MLQKWGTWKLVNRLKYHKVIGRHWLYVIKYGPNSNILCYKARLIAQGYSQIPGLDYSDMFSPTVWLNSLWVILHYTAAHGWYCGQDDVTGAFLHSKINHTIYIYQFDGFDDGSGCVAALLLSLYGIKQGSHLWNKHMNQKLTANSFIHLLPDYAVYIRQTETGKSITTIHINNALTIASNPDYCWWRTALLQMKTRSRWHKSCFIKYLTPFPGSLSCPVPISHLLPAT